MRIQWSILIGTLLVFGVLGVTALNARGTAALGGTTVDLPFVANPTSSLRVSLVNYMFQPTPLHVPVGATVVWTNTTTSTTHTVTADGGAFDMQLSPGATFSFQFTSAGTFAYYCRFHGGPGGQGMSGSIVVGP